MSTLIANLSNTDVRWDGNFTGLTPELTGEVANQLPALGDEAVPELLQALSDPDKFVAAHVVLTKIAGVEYQAFPAWNGLVVDLAADGTVKIDPAQQPVLIDRWQRWYDTQPHPTALPEAN